MLSTFPLLFPGFSCHGSWREHEGGLGGGGGGQASEYLIVKEAASGRRLCARISEGGGADFAGSSGISSRKVQFSGKID